MQALKTVLLVTGVICAAAPLLAQNAPLETENAWARASPGNSDTGAAYVTVRSPSPDRLVAASTPVAKKAELHTMSMSGMVMKMRPVAGIDIPAGQPVALAPGGLHIMLIGLKQPLKAGQSFPLTLDFAKAGARTVDVKVEKVGAAGPSPAAAQH
jgi:copper(I)-binding protein